MRNEKKLIEFILNETEYGIALIPHVLMKNNNDLKPLKILYDEYKDSGRVCLIDEDDSLNCQQIKNVISKCAFMVTT